jgi:hypothetical protein
MRSKGYQVNKKQVQRIRREATRDLGFEPSQAQRSDGIHEIYTLLAELVPAVKVVMEAQK